MTRDTICGTIRTMLRDLDLDLLERNPEQALKPLRPQDLLTVRKVGLVEPVVVRPLPSPTGPTRYQILRGERWWRIAGLLGYEQVPAVIHGELDERDALAFATSENNNSEDPIAEARALHDLLKQERMSISQLARHLGRTRTALSHLLRLLKLPLPVQALVQSGEISAGTARALITLPDSAQLALAEEAIAQDLSTREVEKRARNIRNAVQTKTSKQITSEKDANTAHLESELSTLLGCEVQIERGRLAITYVNLDILDGILERLGYSTDGAWD